MGYILAFVHYRELSTLSFVSASLRLTTRLSVAALAKAVSNNQNFILILLFSDFLSFSFKSDERLLVYFFMLDLLFMD